MNYLWELVVKANQDQMPEDEITYRYPKRYSPYLELNLENLNEIYVEKDVEINPYYRFSKIFSQMYLPDDQADQEIKAVLFDLFIHYIGKLDASKGMTKRDYQIKFVIADIQAGLFGKNLKNNFDLFSFHEQREIAQNLLQLYMTNEAIFLLKKTVKYLYPKSIQFVHLEEKSELTIFLQTKKTPEEEQKMQMIKDLFLPIKYSLDIYYEYMFAILEEDAFIKLDEIMLI